MTHARTAPTRKKKGTDSSDHHDASRYAATIIPGGKKPLYSAGPVLSLIQTKVRVGSADDPYEREADTVADRLATGRPAPPISRLSPGSLIQRQPQEEEPVQRQAEEEEPIQRQSEEEEAVQMQAEKEETVQTRDNGRAATSGNGRMAAAASRAIHSRGSGYPLPPTSRHKLERGTGIDLGDVRVHSDHIAHQTNQTLEAHAFTHRNHIWLGAGESAQDTRLMAHETAHVLQQDGVVRRQPLEEDKASPTMTQGPSLTSGGGGALSVARARVEAAAPLPQPAPPETAATETAPSLASAEPTPTATGNGGAPGGAIAPPQAGAAEAEAEAPAPAEGEGPAPEETEEGAAGESEAIAGGAGAAAAPGTAPSGDAGAATGTEELLMPPPPEGLSPEEQQRLQQVQSNVAGAATATAEMPSAETQTTEARGAVEEPEEETQARADSALVAALDQRPEPSPEIEQLCDRIYAIIRAKRPPDEESLVEADPEEMAQEAGGQLNASVEGDAERVQGSYDELQHPQEGTPQQQSEAINVPPTSVATPDINATAATPEGVSQEGVSLEADVAANQQRQQEAGMTTEPATLIQDPSNPVTQAREAQGELEETAARRPAEVMAEQQAALNTASADMAALQAQALQSLQRARSSSVGSTHSQQLQMVGSEEQMRAQVSAQAQSIVNNARTQVENQLRPLPQTAMDRWESGVAILSTRFEQHLSRVERWIDERHSGVGGAILSAVDYLTGLPDWVTEEYDEAEEAFGDGVCTLIREISTEVNSVIAAAEAIIAEADQEVQALFDSLPAELQEWAVGERERFGDQLNQLHNQVQETQQNINQQLTERASGAVQQVRERVHELRQEAGGLVGRIVDAVNSFLEDPAKFIIEGLLKILGIPPASFWAVVNRIQQVISDIADDPLGFASNLLAALAQGFRQFFDNIGTHLLQGLLDWLFSGLGSVGVQIPTDFSLKSVITFFLQVMGITWERIRRLLAKHIGEENVALIEKAWELVSTLIEQGPEGIFEMIREQLDPQRILDMVLDAAIDFLVEALIKQATVRILALFNPVGAIVQALEAIYRVLKWVFENAARIFSLIETIVNGIADIIAGNISGMANAVEQALVRLIAPVIDFLAGYLSLGDLPEKIADVIRRMQDWVEGILDRVIGFIASQARRLLSALGIGPADEDAAVDEEDPEKAQRIREGLAAIDQQQRAYLNQEGEINREEADQVALRVKNQYPVFKSLRVIDGDNTWDYAYEASPMKKKMGKKKEGHPSEYVEKKGGKWMLKSQYQNKTFTRDRCYGKSYRKSVRDWKREMLTNPQNQGGLRHPTNPDKYFYKGKYFENSGNTIASLDHTPMVVQHWNATGRKKTQDVRKDFFNNLSHLTIVPLRINSSEGASIGESYDYKVTKDFRGPGES